MFFTEKEKVTEIVRYKLGSSECSNAIELKENKYFHNSCKWTDDSYTFITDVEITKFVLSINKQMIGRQKKVRPQKGKCAITKYVYKIKYGADEYVLDEVLCKGDPNCFLVNQLHNIFKELDKK